MSQPKKTPDDLNDTQLVDALIRAARRYEASIEEDKPVFYGRLYRLSQTVLSRMGKAR